MKNKIMNTMDDQHIYMLTLLRRPQAQTKEEFDKSIKDGILQRARKKQVCADYWMRLFVAQGIDLLVFEMIRYGLWWLGLLLFFLRQLICTTFYRSSLATMLMVKLIGNDILFLFSLQIPYG